MAQITATSSNFTHTHTHTNRACVWVGARPLEIQEHPINPLGPNNVRYRLCQLIFADLMLTTGRAPVSLATCHYGIFAPVL